MPKDPTIRTVFEEVAFNKDWDEEQKIEVLMSFIEAYELRSDEFFMDYIQNYGAKGESDAE